MTIDNSHEWRHSTIVVASIKYPLQIWHLIKLLRSLTSSFCFGCINEQEPFVCNEDDCEDDDEVDVEDDEQVFEVNVVDNEDGIEHNKDGVEDGIEDGIEDNEDGIEHDEEFDVETWLFWLFFESVSCTPLFRFVLTWVDGPLLIMFELLSLWIDLFPSAPSIFE